ncbi:Putative acetyltransferase [Mycobacteroides abscessus subsp. massiliense]|nr:Putative acetyltransferase [Mycobacteroides abscessus subsp. massiliense]SKK83200.1 Putative acetyltransferase [Mycobacteroides abscessus subsp. massiliense]SKK95200.1 putative acetyltransferase [Mycobacteroides abscessus subsp. massiliense]SKL49914.1 putative acetyltransferase [Mycobacteroides abscessus subsp. massiliense]SKQ40569.1 Putative acetyltransferase [Mycobacteroides abscessus subsp. massiliense]
MEPVELQTDRLMLRAVADADAAAIVDACNDPEILHYLPLPVP